MEPKQATAFPPRKPGIEDIPHPANAKPGTETQSRAAFRSVSKDTATISHTRIRKHGASGPPKASGTYSHLSYKATGGEFAQ